MLDDRSCTQTLFSPNFDRMLNVDFLNDEQFYIWDVEKGEKFKKIPNDLIPLNLNEDLDYTNGSVKTVATRIQLISAEKMIFVNTDNIFGIGSCADEHDDHKIHRICKIDNMRDVGYDNHVLIDKEKLR